MKTSFNERRFSRSQASSNAGLWQNIGRAIGDLIVKIFTAVTDILRWLTGVHGGQIALSLLALYFLAINIESYWQAIGEGAFMPKPFVRDGADFSSLGSLLMLPMFWVTSVVVVGLNAVSAIAFRDVSIAYARKRYNAVANEHLPSKPRPGDSLAIAYVRYRELENAGMKKYNLSGFGVLFCLGIDLVGNYANFPWWGSSVWFIYLVWWLASSFGFEVCGALLDTSREKAKSDATTIAKER